MLYGNHFFGSFFLISEGFVVYLIAVYIWFSLTGFINKEFFRFNKNLELGLKLSFQYFTVGLFFYLFLIFCTADKKFFTYFFSLYNSNFILCIKIFAVFFSMFLLIMSLKYLKNDEILKSHEFFSIFAISFLGMLFLATAADLLSIYLALELQSLSLYVLAGYKQNSIFSIESALKYFVLGTIASGFLLYSVSFLYGMTGMFRFTEISMFFHTFLENGLFNLMIFSTILMLVPFLFKISAAPFHIWTPDVYEGAPTLITYYFSLIPKIVFMGLIIRLSFEIFFLIQQNWKVVLYYSSILSFLVGAFGGLFQYKIKRLLAYSTIANVGFLLAIILIQTIDAFASALIYFLAYGIAVMGIFANLIFVRYYSNYLKLKNIFEYIFLLNYSGSLSLILMLNLFSFVGIPPLPGFFAKLFVFLNLLLLENYVLFIVSIVCSVLSAYYYLRLIKILFFKKNIRFSLYMPIPFDGALVLSISFSLAFIFMFEMNFLYNLFLNVNCESFISIFENLLNLHV
jgi:NADH-quinone oxidoreductase subunit N